MYWMLSTAHGGFVTIMRIFWKINEHTQINERYLLNYTVFLDIQYSANYDKTDEHNCTM